MDEPASTKGGKLRPLDESDLAVMDRIERQVIAQGINWSELARRVGKTSSAASQWSSRRALPRLQSLHAIAKELGVPLSWLLTGKAPSDACQARNEIELEMLALLRHMSPSEQKAALVAARRLIGRLDPSPDVVNGA
jgi:transcriptional regulator with XRE-family HTH domain